MDTISHHYLIEFYGIDSNKLDDTDWIEHHMLSSLSGSGATYVNHYFHKFTPQGVSGVIVIAESHLSIHTWPEKEYAALDVFTCGPKTIADNILQHLTTELGPKSSKVDYILRGNL